LTKVTSITKFIHRKSSTFFSVIELFSKVIGTHTCHDEEKSIKSHKSRLTAVIAKKKYQEGKRVVCFVTASQNDVFISLKINNYALKSSYN
jgi:hypothetical protein